MTPAQCRAARAFLGWSIDRAAERFGVGRSTIYRIEAEKQVEDESRERIIKAFREVGIVFLNEIGLIRIPVRNKK